MKTKSDLKLIIISFLKENNIQYFCDNQSIIISCFNCGSELAVSCSNSNWRCTYCNESGNLKTLIDHKHKYKTQPLLYNPRNEKNDILRSIRTLIELENDETIKGKLESIYDKTHKLTNYLLNKKEPEF